jgi:hypothetical protein
MIYSEKGTVTTAGTRVPLAASRNMCGWLTVHANVVNGQGTGYIYLGDITTKNNTGGPKAYIGHPIKAGDWVSFRELGGPAYIDLSTIYIDADGDGYKFTFNYGRR